VGNVIVGITVLSLEMNRSELNKQKIFFSIKILSKLLFYMYNVHTSISVFFIEIIPILIIHKSP